MDLLDTSADPAPTPNEDGRLHAGLPETLSPERRICIMASHPTLGDDLFYRKLSAALRAYADASEDTMGDCSTQHFEHGGVRITVTPYFQRWTEDDGWLDRQRARLRIAFHRLALRLGRINF